MKLNKYISKINNIPYKIPIAYSLNEEALILNTLANNTAKMQEKYIKKDIDAIAGDWEKVGSQLRKFI